jgi:hypothetical protein
MFPYLVGSTVCALAVTAPFFAWRWWAVRREKANLSAIVEGFRTESTAPSLERKLRVVR